MRPVRTLAALVAVVVLVWMAALGLRPSVDPVAIERETVEEQRPALSLVPPAPPARPDLGATRATVEKASEPASGQRQVADEVVLRSAHGLPLRDVALRALSEAEWTRAEVPAHATVVIPAADHIREVHAGGHAVALVPSGAGEVTLEARALLELRLPRASPTTWRTSSVGGNRALWWSPFSVADAVDGVWRVAVDPTAAAADERLRPPLELEVDVGTGWRVHATWSLRVGDRIVEELPERCVAPPPLSTALHAIAVGGDEAVTDLVWDFALDPALGPAVDPLDEGTLERPWGTLRLFRSLATMTEHELDPDGRRVRFDGAVVGARYHVRASTTDRRWIGRAFVVCDGDPRQTVEVTLEPGRSFSACLVDARTGNALGHRDVTVRLSYGGRTCEGWGCLWNDRSVVRPGEDGCLTFPGCGFPPAMVTAPWPAPDALALEIVTDGYRPWTRDVSWNGRVPQSLGYIRLEPMPPDLLLRLAQEGLDSGPAFLHLADPWTTDIVSVDLVDVDTAGAWCDPDDRERILDRIERSLSMLVEQDRGGPTWLVAGFVGSPAGDAWNQLTVSRYAFDVRIAKPLADDEHLRAGLAWRGSRLAFEDLARSEARRFGFARELWGPSEGLSLWIEARDRDGEIVRRIEEPLAPSTTVVSF